MATRASDGYRTVAIENFSGLDVRRDPQDASPIRAIDMLNVDLDGGGNLRTRPGTTKVTSISSATETLNRIFTYKRPAGSDSYLVTVNPAATNEMQAYNANTGALAASTSISTSWINSAAMVGVPAGDARMYLCVQGSGQLLRFDGSAFSFVGSANDGKYIAVQSPDNRVAVGQHIGAPSRVRFSEANNPESFLADDYVDLTPGDGEYVVWLEAWQNYLFAFKRSTFHVFYGNSTDATGGAVFNYRTVRHNLWTPERSARPAVAGREGVYFLAKDGVYLTDGGNPRKVSAALDPLFTGGDDAGYFTSVSDIAGGSVNPFDAGVGLYYVAGRLYLTVETSTGTNDGVFVFDPPRGAWMFWRLGVSDAELTGIAPVLLDGGAREVPYFAFQYPNSTETASVIAKLDYSATTDAVHTGGTAPAVASYYQTNFLDLGEPGAEKVIREVEFEGAMSALTCGLHINTSRSSDTIDVSGSITTAPLHSAAATWPAYKVGMGRMRRAMRGRNFSLQIGDGSSSTSWVVHRAMLHLRDQRPAGIKSQ